MTDELQLVEAIAARLKEQLAAAHPQYRYAWVVDFPASPKASPVMSSG